MYRIYDTASAIRQVQIYLALVGNPDIIVVPSGVYDDNTRLSVEDFQREQGFETTGVVNLETFDKLYEVYVIMRDAQDLNSKTHSFISFPILPGKSSDGMIHINKMLAELLNYYGYTHNLRESSFYSGESERALEILSEILGAEYNGAINENFYIRMTKDYDSISRFRR